jgi:hypothetical protein
VFCCLTLIAVKLTEDEPHVTIRPEIEVSENGLPVLAKAEDTNAMSRRAFEEFAQQHDLDDQERLDLLVWMVGDCVADVEGVLDNALVSEGLKPLFGQSNERFLASFIRRRKEDEGQQESQGRRSSH